MEDAQPNEGLKRRHVPQIRAIVRGRHFRPPSSRPYHHPRAAPSSSGNSSHAWRKDDLKRPFPHSFHQKASPPKKRKFDHALPKFNSDTYGNMPQSKPTFPPVGSDDASPPKKNFSSQLRQSKHLRTPKKQQRSFIMTVDLPPECFKGTPNNKRNRRNWVARRTKELELADCIKIHSHKFSSQTVDFLCERCNSEDPPPIIRNESSKSSNSVTPSFHLSPTPSDVSGHPRYQLPGVVPRCPSPTPDQPAAFRKKSLSFLHNGPVNTYTGCGVFLSGKYTLTAPSIGTSKQTETALPSPVAHLSSPRNSLIPSKERSPSVEIIGELAPIEDPPEPQSSSRLRAPSPSPPLNLYQVSSFSSAEHPSSPVINGGDLIIPVDELCRSIRIPSNRTFDKPRRLLPLSDGPSSSILVVSSHGCIDSIDVSPLSHEKVIRSYHSSQESIDDACLLDNRSSIVLGHGREQRQVTLVRLDARQGIREEITLNRPWNKAKKGGVSAVASMCSSGFNTNDASFVTGGYDHIVHLWGLDESGRKATPTALPMKHSSQVQALLPIRDTSTKLLSAGADCTVNIFDLPSQRVVNSIKSSSSVYQVHELVESPFCNLYQVGHRELPFEIRDRRIVPEQPVQRFGISTSVVNGRYIKGAVNSNLFACGTREGSITLWDVRSLQQPAAEFECARGRTIMQVIFCCNGTELLAASQDHQIWLQPVGDK